MLCFPFLAYGLLPLKSLKLRHTEKTNIGSRDHADVRYSIMQSTLLNLVNSIQGRAANDLWELGR